MRRTTVRFMAAAVTLVPAMHIGWKVNRTTGGNVCTVASKDACGLGEAGSAAGAFTYLNSVAIDPNTGNLYVADSANNRVQELSATGTFIAMFGWDVNETEDRRAGATQAARDLCTAASGDTCTAGMAGTAAGQLTYPASIAVAPGSNDLYVLEHAPGDFRVDKYSPEGRFEWTSGKGVNLTTGANLCTEREIERSHARCGPGAENAADSIEPAAFKFGSAYGDLLAVGGPEEKLYVGDEHRVQELAADGGWVGEILLASLSAEEESDVAALALDPSGALYVAYRVIPQASGVAGEQVNVIHKFNSEGVQVGEFAVMAQQANATASVNGLALDTASRLAVIGNEFGRGPLRRLGQLYNAAGGSRIAAFSGPSDNDGIAFNRAGDLYVAATDDQEVAVYAPEPVEALVTSPVACEVASQADPAAALNCALNMG